MKKSFGTVIAAVIAAGMVLSLAACGGGGQAEPAGETQASAETQAPAETRASADEAWTAEGVFIDDAENHLVLLYGTEEDGYPSAGWSASLILDGVMYGGFPEEQDGALVGNVTNYDSDGNEGATIAVTFTETADGVLMRTDDGAEYAFVVDDTDYSAMYGPALPFFQYTDIYMGTDSFSELDLAAYNYLSFDKETGYDPEHAMIPFVHIVGVDESDPADVLIYGDYYLWEFAQEDDVLVAVSGGHCPGILHAERFGEGETAVYQVSALEAAYTTADEAPLFGEYYEDYLSFASDDQTRDAAIAQVIADYVRTNGLEITRYQIGGDEAIPLP